MLTVSQSGGRAVEFAQQLVWREEDGHVTVTARDEDRFVVGLHRAVEALQQVAQAEQFERQLRLLLRIIAEWLNKTKSVDKAFLTVRDGMLCLLIVREAVEYDEEFEDTLSALDIDIANDVHLSLIRMSSIALPMVSDEAFASFLHPDFTLEIVHGAGGRPHSTGKQKSRSA
jgi:hypothetical protein